MGLKDAIRSSDDLPKKPVNFPEWNLGDEALYVRMVSAAKLDAFERLLAGLDDEGTGGGSTLAEFFSIVTCDANGDPVFDWDAEDDRKILLGKSPQALLRVLKPAMELNGGLKDQADALVEKSETAPDSASGSS